MNNMGDAQSSYEIVAGMLRDELDGPFQNSNQGSSPSFACLKSGLN